MVTLTSLKQLLANSKRITTSGDWIPEVDGVRFVAIMMVLVTHAHERIMRRTAATYQHVDGSVVDIILRAGKAGVLVFFTLSGFILGKILMRRYCGGLAVDLRAFYLRRVTRLEPPYLLIMTGLFVLLAVTGFRSNYTRSFEQGASSLSDAWLASMCYSYCFTYGTLPKLNPPAWSLEIEVQFYILAPLFAWLVTRIPKGLPRFLSLIVAGIALAEFVSPIAQSQSQLRYTLLTYVPYFVLGFAVVEVEKLAWAMSRGAILDALAVIAFCGLLTERWWIPAGDKVAISSIATFLFVSGCLYGTYIRKCLRIHAIALIGGMCYTTYLIHLPILEVIAGFSVKLGRGLPYPVFLMVQLFVLIPVVLAIAWVLFRVLERPCMDRQWPVKLWQRIRLLIAAWVPRRE